MALSNHVKLIVLSPILMCAVALAEDRHCPVVKTVAPPRPAPGASLSSSGTPAAVADLASVMAAVVSSFDVRRASDSAKLLQQVNEEVVRQDAQNTFGAINYSAAERARQARSAGCNTAFKKLQVAFNASKGAMEWDASDGGLERFVIWHQDPARTRGQLEAAKPVLEAQRDYSAACLQADIPDEMNSLLVRRAVGLLFFDEQPVCTAVRTGTGQVKTALHCFLNVLFGDESEQLKLAKQGKAKYWFAYEAEPQNRYEVCATSLPKAAAGPLFPVIDLATLAIANTSEPVPELRWITTPAAGSALYLRGYFAYADATTSLGRLRSSAFGGCATLNARGRCLLHACQTTPIMSGAPVFLRPEPGATQATLDVVGLHLGAASYGGAIDSASAVCDGFDGNKLARANFAYQPGP